MESYTIALEFDDTIVIFKVLNNEKSIVEFEFENTASPDEWINFVNNVKNDNSDSNYSLIFQDMNGTTCMSSHGEYFDIHVSDAGHGHSSLTVTLKKNQSLFDALNNVSVTIQEN